MKILVVGVGLMGGSFALALKEQKNVELGGVDLDQEAMKDALALGIVSQSFPSISEGLKWADVIILSVPVDAIKKLLPEILNHLEDHQTVIDFGSTKASICHSVNTHPRRSQFIAAHPIAGTEHSGPKAAFAELYNDKNLILCDTDRSDADKLSKFEALALEVGFYLTKMDAEEHDRHLAYISHLSHITSFALSNAVLKREKDGEVILELAGSGFASTVRLAKSSPEMWSSIFLENREMVLRSIRDYKEEIADFEALIESGSKKELERYLEEGRSIRKILK